MQTKSIPLEFQHTSPAGAEVRPLMETSRGGIAHCTLRRDRTSKAVAHQTVSEFWHILSGKGEIWRKQDQQESITQLEPGITIDIPLGTEFQYRSNTDSDLVFICITMPAWPGPNEVRFVEEGAWARISQ